jgi:hypothetical protein
MKIRFQADNDLDQRIVVATRRLDPTIDFQKADALKLHGSGYSGAEADCGRGENFGFARPAYAAWILQGVHINGHFAWPNHRCQEIACWKSSGATSFALGR